MDKRSRQRADDRRTADPDALPVPASAPYAFAARSAALRLAAIFMFQGARRARGATARLAKCGVQLDLAAKAVDRMGRL